MIDLFTSGQAQTISAVLANRDQRVAIQNRLVNQNQQTKRTVIAVKLNIPGPIKNNSQLETLFQQGFQALTKFFKVESQLDWLNRPTGPEAFLVVSDEPAVAKQQAVNFEDQHLLGRLFDVDVLQWHTEIKQAQPISRQSLKQKPRRCLICEQPAKVCSRSRRHSVSTLQDAINHQYQLYMEREG